MSISKFIEECETYEFVPDRFWAKQLEDGRWRYFRYDIVKDEFIDGTTTDEFFKKNFRHVKGDSWKELQARNFIPRNLEV